MKVSILDVGKQNGPLMPELSAAFERVMGHGQFILGPEVTNFERMCSEYLGVKHCVGVSSGTDALLVALMALDVGPGDEVITTPFSFFATVGCIARLGATPVFVDIDPATFNLDVAAVAAKITPRTKAILPVHLFGQSAPMTALREIARGIPIIEDAAQSLGASQDGKKVGALGTMGCFSFFPSKNLGCMGDGGLVSMEDDALAEKVRVLRAHGSKPKYYHSFVGGNFRLDALQAALLAVKLPHLDAWHGRRRENAAFYDSALAGIDALLLPKTSPGHVYNQYVVRTSKRNELEAFLAERGVQTAIYYPLPLHLQKCFASYGFAEGSFPESERAAKEVLAIPVHSELEKSERDYVAESIRAFFK